ncbi:MAG: hypothetical protein K6357_01255 [Elusimicrobiota bacterium]
MNKGKWLEPRYPSKEVFEKDFPKLDINGISVSCPGCMAQISLNRKSVTNKSAGWCKKCNRAVTI